MRIRNLFPAVLLFLGFLGACTSADDKPEALLNVVLIDAPPLYDSVFVEIFGVNVTMNVQGRETEEQTFFIEYELGDKQVKVSDYVGGEVLLLGREPLPPGQIIGMELEIGTSNYLWENEDRYNLPLVETATTLIPIDIEMFLESGFSYDVVLDFDLEKSIQTVNPDPLTMTFDPYLHVLLPGDLGEIYGTISQDKLRPAIFAIQDGDSTSTHVNEDMGYYFRLPEGTYDLYFDPKNDGFLADTLLGVEVVAGESQTLDLLTFRIKP